MARVCALTGKTVHFGNNVSHSKRRTRRRWQPNLQEIAFDSEGLGRVVSLRITANAIRTIEFHGGLDAYLRTTKASKMTTEIRKLKKQLEARTPEAA